MKIIKINKANNMKMLIKDFIQVLQKEEINYNDILKSDLLNNSKIIDKEEHFHKIKQLEKFVKLDRNYNITWHMLKTSLYLRCTLIRLYINIIKL